MDFSFQNTDIMGSYLGYGGSKKRDGEGSDDE
jgi:hypothetical protein